MAVVAASIGAFFLNRQLRQGQSQHTDQLQLAREQHTDQLRQAREQHADERWWDSLRWTYEAITEKRTTPGTLSPDVSVLLLVALQDEAEKDHGTEFQRRTIGALAAAFRLESAAAPDTGDNDSALEDPGSPQVPSNVDAADDGRSPGPRPYSSDATVSRFARSWRATPILAPTSTQDDLRALLERTAPDSPEARARLGELAVADALASVRPQWTLRSNVVWDYGRGPREFDLLVQTADDRVVFVEVKTFMGDRNINRPLKPTLGYLTRSLEETKASGALLVILTDKPELFYSLLERERAALRGRVEIVADHLGRVDGVQLADAVERLLTGPSNADSFDR